ncbi:hypothetical protein [Streptomyces cinnamoneus]|uniref:hypothetical protein n=1 Tax=Streptomyces cinnamoneus TaxID=53446 RepID=UPI0011AFE9A1|nr:hypothetical protein [Streptomyces cinnamoneus]
MSSTSADWRPACLECGDVPELLDEDLTCGPCRIRIYLKGQSMKKTVKFSIERTTEAEVELELTIPDEFLDEDGEISDEDGFCEWLNDNPGEWDLSEPFFEEIQDTTVLELLNSY